MKWLSSIGLLFLLGCGASYQNSVADSAVQSYRMKISEYQSTEDEYMNTLFNLERMPDDTFLLRERVVLKDSLYKLRDELKELQIKSESALSEWDTAVRQKETEYKTIQNIYDDISNDLLKNLGKDSVPEQE